jgi:hypothetical protein
MQEIVWNGFKANVLKCEQGRSGIRVHLMFIFKNKNVKM